MALPRVKNWVAGEVLTYQDLNNEFNNIINNGSLLVQPWVGDFDLDGNDLIFDQDGDTSIDASTDDTLDVTINGADDFRITADTFTALSGSDIVVVDGDVQILTGNFRVTNGGAILQVEDTRTNTVATPVNVIATTSSAPAAGIGVGILYKVESNDEDPSDVGVTEFIHSDVTAGGEDSLFSIRTRVNGAALVSTWQFQATAANAAYHTHNNSATRTYTWPNVSMTVTGETNAATLQNKTINGTQNTLSNIGPGALSSSTASTTLAGNAAGTITMNEYSFFPSVYTKDNSAGAGGSHNIVAIYSATAEPGTTISKFRLIPDAATGGNAADLTTIRWRYLV